MTQIIRAALKTSTIYDIRMARVLVSADNNINSAATKQLTLDSIDGENQIVDLALGRAWLWFASLSGSLKRCHVNAHTHFLCDFRSSSSVRVWEAAKGAGYMAG